MSTNINKVGHIAKNHRQKRSQYSIDLKLSRQISFFGVVAWNSFR